MAQLITTTKLTKDITLVGAWEGGPYIDLSTNGISNPKEVINVWDYEKGVATIPFTQAALKRRVRDWVGAYGREELIHDIKENWY